MIIKKISGKITKNSKQLCMQDTLKTSRDQVDKKKRIIEVQYNITLKLICPSTTNK